VADLRDYQQRAIDQLYAWFDTHASGNPCIEMPTGSGKSHIVAALCKDALQNWPETRVLMLTHVKELIEQNAEKMQLYWPDAPLGIYSASIGSKKLDDITFAGIQSIYSQGQKIGHIDLVIIDEAHLVNHAATGMYRTLIDNLTAINPAIRIVGLTATPYRLGHGLITDKPALFDAILKPVGMLELIQRGYLAPLRSKATKAVLDVSGVHTRGGEYVESELQAAVDKDQTNEEIAREIVDRAGDRKAWLLFCSGIRHAQHMMEELQELGIPAACVTGETPKKEREQMLAEFRSGQLRALTNANVLTTGFDHPDIDLIAMLRPTKSPGLYVQMAGRGLRVKSHIDHCLVLDFAGVVAMHGPLIAVTNPKKPREGEIGTFPAKKCPSCNEIMHAALQVCPSCGHQFPTKERPKLALRDDDIMGLEKNGLREMQVAYWRWKNHTSKASGKDMVAVTYYPEALSDQSCTEYFPITHDGYAGQRAISEVAQIMRSAGVQSPSSISMPDLNASNPPATIKYKMDGKYMRVIERRWR